MARTFNGTTDKITTTLTAHAAQRTYFLRAWRTSPGGGGLGRMWEKRVAGAQVEIMRAGDGGTGLWEYARQWTGEGRWSYGEPTDGAWHSISLSYDSGSTANNPVVYIDGASVTVTTVTAPTGTLVDNTDAYVIGGRGNDNLRGYDGNLAEFAVWDRVLTADERVALDKGYSPLFIPGLVEYVPLWRDVVSFKRAQPTATGTTVATVGQYPLFLPTRPLVIDGAAGGANVTPADIALALGIIAPASIDQEVSPGALALALDAPSPAVTLNLDPGAIALSLGIVAPDRIDLDLSPADIALDLAAQAPARVDLDASPAALALALATVAPDFLATIDPAALAIALTAQAPGRIDQDASPAAIALTLGTPTPSVEPRVDPGAIDLVLTPVAPARLDLALDMPAISLTLSPQAPTRIDLDLTLTPTGLVLTPVAPTRLDQDATLTAIAITLDTPAPIVDLAGALTVSPGLITLLLTPEAPRADQEASLAPIALTVGVATPALELGVEVGALSLTLTPEAPVRIDQEVLAQVLAITLGILSPSLEAIVEPGALSITLGAPTPTLTVVVTASDGSIRMVSVPLAMGRASVMAGGSSVRLVPGAMTSTEPTTRPD